MSEGLRATADSIIVKLSNPGFHDEPTNSSAREVA